MEPAETTIVYHAMVMKVEQKFKRRWLGGIGNEAQFADDSQGWFVHLEDSHEALFVGLERPKILLGTVATIRISFPCPA